MANQKKEAFQFKRDLARKQKCKWHQIEARAKDWKGNMANGESARMQMNFDIPNAQAGYGSNVSKENQAKEQLRCRVILTFRPAFSKGGIWKMSIS